jgi:alpha-aminoadipate/glutamate carrier protein LysW
MASRAIRASAIPSQEVTMPASSVSGTVCPECESDLELREEVMRNEIIECPDCRCELEVIGVSPLILAVAPEIEEDWGE